MALVPSDPYGLRSLRSGASASASQVLKLAGNQHSGTTRLPRNCVLEKDLHHAIPLLVN
ncbi:hypothetical protein ASPFODRAFT_53500, partial [Aspergillus luchuensis CBS 106.47]